MIDFERTLANGGRELIAFLEYCIGSVQMDPLFVVLARDFRIAPSTEKLIALHDELCAPRAPAKISAKRTVDLRFSSAVEKVRAAASVEGAPRLLVDRAILDAVVAELRAPGGQLEAAARAFDPALSTSANLPGGRMSAGQRAFKEQVWQKRVRPKLVAAGFTRVAPLGG